MNKIFTLAISVFMGVSMFFIYAGPVMAGEGKMAKSGESESCPLDWSVTRPAHFSGFIGALALDRENQELGRVVDAVGSSEENGISFLIISSCLPGMKDKLVAFPVRAYNPPHRLDTVVINTTKQEFQGAPTIESKAWASPKGTAWVEEFYNYFKNTF